MIGALVGERIVSHKIIIMGAAGRDFHVFNCCYRDKPEFDIVAFTATQIPHIDDRRYPAALAGAQYPDGIRIHPEEELNDLLKNNEGRRGRVCLFRRESRSRGRAPQEC